MATLYAWLFLLGTQLFSLASASTINLARHFVGDSNVPSPTPSEAQGCPDVWNQVRADLWPFFKGCSRGASFAIRFAFHDSAATSIHTPFYAPAAGGADGSLLLNDEEAARHENRPLPAFRGNLSTIYDKYKTQIGAADLVQFASSLAIRACSGGPVVKTVVGRKDCSRAAPEGLLPEAFGRRAAADVLLALFADKGFSPQDLTALVGAHTVSQAFAAQRDGIPDGGRQDSTPTQWDVTFYDETLQSGRRSGIYRFPSDVNLARANETRDSFEAFGANKGAWDAAFVSAMEKMSLLGIPEEDRKGFVDCTDVVQGGA